MSEAWLSLERARQRREQQQENAARHASVYAKHTTSGTGESLSGLIRFDTHFTEPPWVSTGAVIQRLPDVAHYRYPTVTAGVIRWETRPIGPPTNRLALVASGKAPQDDRPKLYLGAWMVFTVQCDPRNIPNTDGSNLRLLQIQRDRIQDRRTLAYIAAVALVKEAQEAQWLLDPKNKARVVVEHHLTFSGVAVKSVDVAQDPLLKSPTFNPDNSSDSVYKPQVQP